MNENPFRRIIFFIFLVLTLGGLLIGTRPALLVLAQQPTPSDDEVNAIAHQLYCPVCENTPLDVCDTEACRQWRNLIRQMLAEGKTEEEINQYFQENYGERVLSEPPTQGFNWLVYVIPPIAFIAGAFFLFRTFRDGRRMANKKEDKSTLDNMPATINSLYADQFEEELRKRK